MKNGDGKSSKSDPSKITQENHVIFSSDEQKIELLGQVFGNKTSRDIITKLIEEEMTASQISENLGIKMNLVLYHLNKMLEQIISVSKLTKSSRGHQVKHYRAKQAVMIFSKNASERANKSKSLSHAIKRVTRFSAIGIAGVLTWFAANLNIQHTKVLESADIAFKYPRPTLPPHIMSIESHLSSSTLQEFLIPIVVGSVIVVSLLIINMLVTRKQSTKV